MLAENYPVQLGWCQRWFHEFYTIFESAVQHHFLSTYSASYAEYYYGLKRFPQNKAIKSSTTVSLGKQLHILSIVTQSVFPYMQAKLSKRFDSIKEQYLLQGLKVYLQLKELFYIVILMYICYGISRYCITISYMQLESQTITHHFILHSK